jgi:glycosyltransferase involved in cell wall biosynthesis
VTQHPPLTGVRSAERLAELSKRIRPDLVEVEAFSAGRWLRLGALSSAPRVFKAYDATWDVLEGAIRSPYNVPVSWLGRIAASIGIRDTVNRFKVRRFRADEIKRAAEYDEILVFSRRDARLFGTAGLHTRVVRLPFTPHPLTPTPPPAERLRILFVGTFSYFPNVDAALHLVEDVVPRLSDLPLVVHVAGQSPPPSLRRHHDGNNIVVHGYVPDLDSLYTSTDVFVAPLRLGGGVKLKIMEALGRGLPVVTSQHGTDGLDVNDGRDVIVRNDPQGVADALRQLRADPLARQRLGRAAREYISRYHDVKDTTEELESIYTAIIRQKREYLGASL